MAVPGWTNNFPSEEEDDAVDCHEYSSDLKSYNVLTYQIKNFIAQLYNGIVQGDVNQIAQAYTTTYTSLNIELFSAHKWPHYTVIAPLVQNDSFFLCIYQELYFRHLHSKFHQHLTVEDYVEAFNNYDSLFNMILQRDEPLDVVLPIQMIWDIIDEFLYQFQAFNGYRANVKQRTPQEIELFKQGNIWSVHVVLNILHQLVNKSNVNQQLNVFNEGGDPNEVTNEFGKHTLYKMFGLYALVGLCRLHCQFSDYYLSLKVLEKLNLSQLYNYQDDASCHITTGYYVGFSYMMMRRYDDAREILTNTLSFFSRNQSTIRQQCTSAEKFEYTSRMTEQMYTLLAMCIALQPAKIDDNVHQVLHSKYSEKLTRLQNMDSDEFDISFDFGAPRFLSLTPPDFEDADTYQLVMLAKYQCKLFKAAVKDQMSIPYLRSFLKLYTTIPISKLANFMRERESDVLRKLMCYKHKLQNFSCIISELPSSKQPIGTSQNEFIDFYIEGDMIHISDDKPDPKYSEYFTNKIKDIYEVDKRLTLLQKYEKQKRAAASDGDVGYPRIQHISGSYASALSRQ